MGLPMAGRDEGECIAQNLEVEDLAAGGERKRKTAEAEETVCGGQVFAPLFPEIGEIAKNKKKAAEEGDKPAPAPGPKARMSEREIRCILSWKPMSPPRLYEALKESNPDLAPLPGEEMDELKDCLLFRAKMFYCMQERYPKMQQWIRDELATKGYVEMDDDWVRRRAETEQAIEEGWKEVEKKFEELQFSDDDFDYDDDSDCYEDEEDSGRDNNDAEEGREVEASASGF